MKKIEFRAIRILAALRMILCGIWSLVRDVFSPLADENAGNVVI